MGRGGRDVIVESRPKRPKRIVRNAVRVTRETAQVSDYDDD